MGRPKNPAAKGSIEKAPVNIYKEEIAQEERNRIKNLLKEFINSRGHMIERHLNQVKESTGEIQGQDVAYVINLFTRELNHII